MLALKEYKINTMWKYYIFWMALTHGDGPRKPYYHHSKEPSLQACQEVRASLMKDSLTMGVWIYIDSGQGNFHPRFRKDTIVRGFRVRVQADTMAVPHYMWAWELKYLEYKKDKKGNPMTELHTVPFPNKQSAQAARRLLKAPPHSLYTREWIDSIQGPRIP